MSKKGPCKWSRRARLSQISQLSFPFPWSKFLATGAKEPAIAKAQPPLTVIGSAATAPPPPRKLGPAGQDLWRRIQAEFHIVDSGGVEILCLAAHALDRAESLSAAIAEQGETIVTKGGIRSHPSLRDEISNRALAARLLIRLGVTSEQIKTPGRPASPLGWSP